MMPSLVTIGSFSLSSFGLFVWLTFVSAAFVFWRACRDKGVEDAVIFDNFILLTIVFLIGARLGYVINHWSTFSDALLKIVVIWRYPGLSAWGGMIAALIFFGFRAQQKKIPSVIFFDSLGYTTVVVLFLLSIAVFLDGTVVGKFTSLPWGLPAVGVTGDRHPVALYTAIIAFLGGVVLALVRHHFSGKTPKSAIGWLGLYIVGLAQLPLAFLRDDLVYWGGIAVDAMLTIVLIVVSLIAVLIVFEIPQIVGNFIASRIKKTPN